MPATQEAGSPRRRDPVATRERIIDAARRLFTEKGPQAVTVSDVAHQAGVNRGTAYHHFRTKDDLIAAVESSLSSDMGDGIGRILCLSSVDAQFDAFADYFSDHPEVARFWLFQLLSPSESSSDAGSMAGLEHTVARMRVLADDPSMSQEGIDPEALAVAIMTGVLVWAIRVDGDGSGRSDAVREEMHRYTRELKRLMVHGVFKEGSVPDLEATVEANLVAET